MVLDVHNTSTIIIKVDCSVAHVYNKYQIRHAQMMSVSNSYVTFRFEQQS
jgi:hypothetical protein